MRCYLENLKEVLKDYWLDWLMGSSSANEIALIAVNNKVNILSYYSQNISDLKAKVDTLVSGGLTAINDAILVGLVFENPKPDEIYVWSDLHDTCSDAPEATWTNLSSSLGVNINLTPPYDWMRDPTCWHMVAIATPRIVTAQMALAKIKAISSRVPTVKAIEKPADFIKAIPFKKKE